MFRLKIFHATSGTLVANQKQLPRCLLQAVWTTRLEFNKACRRGYRGCTLLTLNILQSQLTIDFHVIVDHDEERRGEERRGEERRGEERRGEERRGEERRGEERRGEERRGEERRGEERRGEERKIVLLKQSRLTLKCNYCQTVAKWFFF